MQRQILPKPVYMILSLE